MKYYTVKNRCAFNIANFNLPVSEEEALEILYSRGFKLLETNLIEIARSRVGISRYKRGARLAESPDTFDCSGFTKWVYGQKGIWIPRRSIQQREVGREVSLSNFAPGDLIFTTGWRNYFIDNPQDGVGHVGLLTKEKTIIHSSGKKRSVVEEDFTSLLERCSLRGVRRILSPKREIFTVEIPEDLEVESSDDIKWIILQSI